MQKLTPKEAVQLRIRGYEAIAEIQRDELRRQTEEEAMQARLDLFKGPMGWRPESEYRSSGLVEMQSWFKKAKNR